MSFVYYFFFQGYRIKIHLDGWSSDYDFWTDDDWPDLHPSGWCQKTGHPLQPPVSMSSTQSSNVSGDQCPTPGCAGIGHIEGAKYARHRNVEQCPYYSGNLHRENPFFPDRLAGEEAAVHDGQANHKKEDGKSGKNSAISQLASVTTAELPGPTSAATTANSSMPFKSPDAVADENQPVKTVGPTMDAERKPKVALAESAVVQYKNVDNEPKVRLPADVEMKDASPNRSCVTVQLESSTESPNFTPPPIKKPYVKY